MAVRSTPTSVVKLGPQLDVRTVAAARNALYSVMADATDGVVLDMSGVETIDAAGLGMLTAAHLRCERSGHRLVLRNCPPEIRRVLAVTRLNRILHLDRADVPVSA
ncbi:MAG: hypothetical protein QOI06_567 [Nocardioidaceae bacterium]|jgi:anti-sigma B factor antagonist|nr:hypothetical protein [Nocardioidaceae bacterium]